MQSCVGDNSSPASGTVYRHSLNAQTRYIVRDPTSALLISKGILITERRVSSALTSGLRIDEAHFRLNGYVNKQNCRIWSEANPQVHVETPLHPEKLTVWCPLWAGGILLQKR
ncbi:hypothetical protein TNCV_242051 [Trichonephila clavipes]|uniref:Uncharacterized protein n=1 Tax=Trichonephila clavipes TaxID=2585209 RepID=A0A8X7BEJ5_TRICX|nr:hypothetical protein TNCV_242051 [Trichonephila clavipes]